MPLSNGPRFTLGIGLSDSAEITGALALVEEAIDRSGFATDQLECIATIDSRRSHPVLLELAVRFKTEIRTFTAQTLEAETSRLKNPSDALFARIGCHGVAEAAALAAAGGGAGLIVEKMTGRGVTVAIAA